MPRSTLVIAVLALAACMRTPNVVYVEDLPDDHFELSCEVVEEPQSAISVERKSCRDVGPGFLYVYETYECKFDGLGFIARSYTYELENVHFLARTAADSRFRIQLDDIRSPEFQACLQYLVRIGKRRFEWLGESGYQPIPEGLLLNTRPAV